MLSENIYLDLESQGFRMTSRLQEIKLKLMAMREYSPEWLDEYTYQAFMKDIEKSREWIYTTLTSWYKDREEGKRSVKQYEALKATCQSYHGECCDRKSDVGNCCPYERVFNPTDRVVSP